jgi:hypothetical protein
MHCMHWIDIFLHAPCCLALGASWFLTPLTPSSHTRSSSSYLRDFWLVFDGGTAKEGALTLKSNQYNSIIPQYYMYVR